MEKEVDVISTAVTIGHGEVDWVRFQSLAVRSMFPLCCKLDGHGEEL